MGFFSGIFGDQSAKKAVRKLDERVDNISDEFKFAPINVDSRLFNTSFDEGGASANLSPQAKRTFQDFDAMINRTGRAAKNIDQTGLAMDFFNQLNAINADQENRAFNSFESKLFNKGGVHTGTAQQIGDFQNQLEFGRERRKFEAINSAQDFTTNLFNNFLGLNQGRTAMNAASLNPLSLAMNFGQIQSSANNPLLNAKLGVADIQSARQAQSGANFGSLMDDALAFGLDFL